MQVAEGFHIAFREWNVKQLGDVSSNYGQGMKLVVMR
jgi:hypothetical protein